MKVELKKSDPDYREAINYDGTNYYNFPCTVQLDNKKLIVGFGTADSVEIKQTKDNKAILIGKNSGLDYISCIVIDYSKDPEIINEAFIQGSENFEGFIPEDQEIFDLSFDEQYKIILNWFM